MLLAPAHFYPPVHTSLTSQQIHSHEAGACTERSPADAACTDSAQVLKTDCCLFIACMEREP